MTYTEALKDILARLTAIEDQLREITRQPVPSLRDNFRLDDGNCEGNVDNDEPECLEQPIVNINGKRFCRKHAEDAFIELRRLQEMVIDALAPMEAAMKAQGS